MKTLLFASFILLLPLVLMGSGTSEANINSFSLRPAFAKYRLKPQVQGYYACTVFATLGVMEFDYAKAGAPVDLSEQFAEWAAVQASGTRFLNFPYRTVIAGIQKYGVCREELMPYKDPKRNLGRPNKSAIEDAEKRKNVSVVTFHEWNNSFGFNDAEIDSMCRSLTNEQALSCCFRWPTKEAATSREPFTIDTKNSAANLRSNQGVIGHAVLFVGFEKASQWEGGGRFEFRNSFGEKWGDDGYGWVTFGYLKKHGEMAYAVHMKSPN